MHQYSFSSDAFLVRFLRLSWIVLRNLQDVISTEVSISSDNHGNVDGFLI
jgi:hypothetical protein